MNNKQVDHTLKFLIEGWPGPVSDAKARIWGGALAKYDFDACFAACEKLLLTEEFRPSIAKIASMLEAPDQEQASAAFAAVMSAMLLPPGAKGAAVDEATRETVRRMGGWGVVGQWERAKLNFHQRDFERVYADVAESARREPLPEHRAIEPAPPEAPKPELQPATAKHAGMSPAFAAMLAGPGGAA